ncbi:hypothetical protein J6590_102707, partial [Homalodisca vitripennis]
FKRYHSLDHYNTTAWVGGLLVRNGPSAVTHPSGGYALLYAYDIPKEKKGCSVTDFIKGQCRKILYHNTPISHWSVQDYYAILNLG